MKSRRVAIYLPTLHGGGAQRVMLNLADGLARRGYSVDLVLTSAVGSYLSRVPESIHLVDLRAGRVLFSLRGLVNYLRVHKPAAIISAQDHGNLMMLWAHRLASVKETRSIITVHTSHKVKWSSTRQRVKTRILAFLMRVFYRWADEIVAVSKGVAYSLESVTGIPIHKITVIYNPVVANDIFKKAGEELDHPWFQIGQPPVILAVGRLTAAKSFDTLLRAFALVRKKRMARLVILGEGEQRAELERLARDLGIDSDVDIHGFVHNPYKFMRRAACFVLSSKWEGLPTALIEALALGTPSVSTDCPSGPSEILEGQEESLVPVGDISAIAEAILRKLESKQEVSEVNLERYTVDMAVSEYEKLIKSRGV